MPKESGVNTHTIDANGLTDLEGRCAPRQEHNTLTSPALLCRDASGCDSLQNGSCEGLPTLLRVGVCLVGLNGQARIQPKHTLFGDFGEIAEEWVSRSTTPLERRRVSDPWFGILKPGISDATCL